MNRLHIVALLAGLTTFGCFKLAQAQEGSFFKPISGVPKAARVSLEPLQKSYFLGENVLAHFGVKNVGAEPFAILTGGDYRGAARAVRFVISATDAAGNPVRDPHPGTFNMGGFVGKTTLEPNGEWFETLSLLPYLQFDAPGKYRIRVMHDLGWGPTTDDPLPFAEADIELKMPSPEEAEAIVAAMEKPAHSATTEKPAHSVDVRIGEKNLSPQPDSSALRYPVYLPLLKQRIAAGDNRYLESIAGMKTPEATAFLVQLLDAPTSSKAAAKILAKRVPRVVEKPLRDTPWSLAVQEQHERLVKLAWRDEFAAPVRAYAKQALEAPDREGMRTATDLLITIGLPEDLPQVLEMLHKRISMTTQTPRWQSQDPLETTDSGWQMQDDCLMLMRCARVLLQKGAVLRDDPSDVAATAVQISLTKASQQPSPKLETWLRHPTPFIRQLALESLTFPPSVPTIELGAGVRALLPQLLRDSDTSVRAAACEVAGKSGDKALLPYVLEVLAKARNYWLINFASRAATNLGGSYEAWIIWANRLDEKGMIRPAIENLAQIMGMHGYGWSGYPDEKVGAALKPKWQKFLRDNNARLQAGKLFSTSAPDWPKDLFPKQFSISQ